MSREIRYRVWDKKCHIYLDIVGVGVGGKNTKFCGFKYLYCRPQDPSIKMLNPLPMYGGCVGFKLTDGVDSNRLVFEQDTGLKDKNGESIWDGDIVRVSHWHNYKVRQSRTGAWRIGRDDLFAWADSSEVIGNIHENPELLGEKKK